MGHRWHFQPGTPLPPATMPGCDICWHLQRTREQGRAVRRGELTWA